MKKAMLVLAVASLTVTAYGATKRDTQPLEVTRINAARTNDAALTAQEWTNLQELKRYDLATNAVTPTNTIAMPTPLSVAEIVAATNSAAGLKAALQTIRQFQLDQKQADQDVKAWHQEQEKFDRDVRDMIRDVKTLAREFWVRVLGRPKQPGD